jgi:EpsI family protein
VTRRVIVLLGLFLATWGFLARAAKAEPTPIREPLTALPLTIQDWRGRVEPEFEPKILAVLGVDDYTSRTYFRPASPPAGLYVGYYSSQRQGDTIHSPLNCLPGAGWIPVRQTRVVLPVRTAPDGPDQTIEINDVIIEKGLDRQVVYYWYQSHQRVVASEYWGKIFTVVEGVVSAAS